MPRLSGCAWLLLTVGGGVLLAADPPSPAPPPRSPTFSQLLQQLGSEDFAAREEATRLLSNLPLTEPPPALLEALRSPNPEVRQRAAQVVGVIRVRAEKQALGRERVLAKQGRIDQFIVIAATWNLPANDEQLWQTILDIGVNLSKSANRPWVLTNGRVPVTPANFWKASRRVDIRSNKPYRIPDKNEDGAPLLWQSGGIQASNIVAPKGIIRNLIVSDGLVQAGSNIAESIILANGDVKTAGLVSRSIIVADGDVEVADSISNSVVVARGNVTAKSLHAGTTLITGGKVTIVEPVAIQLPKNRSILKENDTHPFDFIRFFEPNQVGVEIKTVEKKVQVAKVIPFKSLTLAGVCVGDVVSKVDGIEIASPEQFRRVLRQAVVRGEGTFTLRREGKIEPLRVNFAE